MEGHEPHSLEYLPVFVHSSNSILHYTCNSPDKKVLDKYGIKAKGGDFGCKDIREILDIPFKVYKKFGFFNVQDKNVLNMNLEKIMRDLK